jgi:TetR/AcrR family transcriptional regulator, cholesterol catabolism regulator
MATASNSSDPSKFDQKLNTILTAATEVFAEDGYDRASIRSVVERAGVSIAGLYYYVRSKEELLYLIQFRAFDELANLFDEESARVADPTDRLELLVRNHLERFLPNMSELIVCSREIDRLQGDYRAEIRAKQRRYFEQALAVFDEVCTGSEDALDPRISALALFGSINWIFTWYRRKSGYSAARLARDLTRLYLRGACPVS